MYDTDMQLAYSEEREKNLALFQPLFHLDASTKGEYTDLPLRQIGMAVLLYILEHMYQTKKDCTMGKISHFLRYLLFDQMGIELSEEEAYELTQHIVAKTLMNGGKAHAHRYWNFKTKEYQTYSFHLIYIEDYAEDGTTYLRLSNECLDMLFKTKELYGELKLSVKALFFKQQMTKNVFEGALQELKEIRADVQNEQDEMELLKRNIRRNVLNHSKREQVKERLASVNKKLDQERVIFREMTNLVKDVLSNLDTGTLGDEEQRAHIMVKKINKSLMEVISEHDILFGKKLDLQRFVSDAIRSLIHQSFSVRINFREEILQRAVEEGLSTEALSCIVLPLLKWKFNKSFHPGVVFEPQNVLRVREKREIENILNAFDEEYDDYVRKKEEEMSEIKIGRLASYFTFTLSPLLTNTEVYLSDLLAYTEGKTVKQDILLRGDFYHFLMELHQLGEITLFTESELEGSLATPMSRALARVCSEHKDIYQIGSFSIEKREGCHEIVLVNSYVLSDFVIRRGYQWSST